MQPSVHLNRLLRIGISLAVVLSLTTIVKAQDWRGLRYLSDAQLSAKITQLRQQLNQKPDDYETLKTLGIAYSSQASRQSKSSIPKAVEFLTKAHQLNPEDSVTLVYLGSSTTMMARTTKNPLRKLKYANRGIALMDKAAKRDPDNVTVRMVRGMNATRLPAIFNRGEVAWEDFEHLASLIEQHPSIPRPVQKDVYTNLAKLHLEADEPETAAAFQTRADAL